MSKPEISEINIFGRLCTALPPGRTELTREMLLSEKIIMSLHAAPTILVIPKDITKEIPEGKFGALCVLRWGDGPFFVEPAEGVEIIGNWDRAGGQQVIETRATELIQILPAEGA